MRLRASLLLAALAGAGVGSAPSDGAAVPATTRPRQLHAVSDYGDREELKSFIAQAVELYQFKRRDLDKLFAQVKAQPGVIRLMSAPVEHPPAWYEYAPRLVNPERIAAGVQFWHDNSQSLERAENEFGVPPEIIVAIIGVETFYGRRRGGYRVLDALTTLAFDYPRRAGFYRQELAEFLLMCREENLPPLDLRGSYAGAMGLPQFMPGTFGLYAIDFDQDGRIDIWQDAADAIGSVANFLAMHGWQSGARVLEPARIDGAVFASRAPTDFSTRRSLGEWANQGIQLRDSLTTFDPHSAATLVSLEEPAVLTYWLAFDNFFVLARYNRSRLYVAAVWQLAQALRSNYSHTGANP